MDKVMALMLAVHACHQSLRHSCLMCSDLDDIPDALPATALLALRQIRLLLQSMCFHVTLKQVSSAFRFTVLLCIMCKLSAQQPHS